MSRSRAKKKQRQRARAGTGERPPACPAAPPQPATPRDRARAPVAPPAPRRPSRLDIRDGVPRPDAIWAPFPLTEIGMAVGLVMFLIGFAGAPPVLLAGVGVLVVVVAELCLREHFGGFRSHSILLGMLPVTTIHLALVVLGDVTWRGPVALAVDLAIAGAAGVVASAALPRRAEPRTAAPELTRAAGASRDEARMHANTRSCKFTASKSAWSAARAHGSVAPHAYRPTLEGAR